MTRGKFIVIDGMDGSGKGTQIKLLQERLANEPYVFSREPGGTPRGEEIRQLLLDPNGKKSNPTCDFFLFWASRASHVIDFVEPQRQEGMHVFSDRYDSSTYAFQIYGEEQKDLLPLFHDVRDSLPQMFKPDLYIILDLPAEVACRRSLDDAARKHSRFDVKPLSYHERVRTGFARFLLTFGQKERVQMVDARGSVEHVQECILRILQDIS